MKWKNQNEVGDPVKSKSFPLVRAGRGGGGLHKIPKYLTIFLNNCDISLIYKRVRVYCHVLAGKFVGKSINLHVNR